MREPTFASLHTLAMLYAGLGKIREARDVLWQGIDLAGAEDPNSETWLVIGRIAEELDAPEAAIAAYQKVQQRGRSYPDAFSSYALAQKRLAALTTK